MDARMKRKNFVGKHSQIATKQFDDNGGLCLTRRQDEGIGIWDESGKFVAYIDFIEIEREKCKVRIVAPRSIDISRSTSKPATPPPLPLIPCPTDGITSTS